MITRQLQDQQLQGQASGLICVCRESGLRLVTAESCTGGLIIGCLTAFAGSSDVVDRGFVTYSNASKIEDLAISTDLLRLHGAVSLAVARAMARGAIGRSKCDIALAATGVAGPGGGTVSKPVGLVFIAVARRNGAARIQRHVFSGDRASVRVQTVRAALALAMRMAAGNGSR